MDAPTLSNTGMPARHLSPARLWQVVKCGLWRARFVLLFLLVLLILGCGLVMTVSLGMADVTEPYLYTPATSAGLPSGDYDGILILGAGLRPDGSPSDMLADRVRIGCELYLSDPERFERLILSGDRTGDYNEVAAMQSLAVELGVPPERIQPDYEGYSTFESVSRARECFGARRILIVTQEYHLHRAVYIARSLGLEAYGLSADPRPYANQTLRDLREALARFKDFYAAGRHSEEIDGSRLCA